MIKFSKYINEDASVKAELEILSKNISKSKEADGVEILKKISNIVKVIDKKGYTNKKSLITDCEEVKDLISKAGYKEKNITWKINNIIDFAGV